jgi:putative oxidoreductase
MLKQIIQTNRHVAPLIIRLMIGAVFLSEGIQKFLYPAELGAGRFQKIGLPNPEFLAPFVGFFEIACGILVILGFVTHRDDILRFIATIKLKVKSIAARSSDRLYLGVDHRGKLELFW